MIEQLPALKKYFFILCSKKKTRPSELRNERVDQIQSLLKSVRLELDLHFLQAVLSHLNRFERLYQTKTVLIHQMYNDVREVFRVLLTFLQRNHVASTSKLKPISFESENWLPDEDFFVGEECRKLLNSRRVTEDIRKRVPHEMPSILLCVDYEFANESPSLGFFAFARGIS